MEMILSWANLHRTEIRWHPELWWKRMLSVCFRVFKKAGLSGEAEIRKAQNGNMVSAGSPAAASGNADENIAQNAEQFGRNAERLLDTFGNAILRMSYSCLHNMSDAEEILQETLIKYLTVQPELHGSEHEKAWLLRVAANLSKNRLDYNRLRDTDELEETLVSQEREDLSFLWEAVKQLPEANREVIHLFYYEGYPTAQIAKILNRRESTVRSDLRRGRERLKKILKEEYDFE